MNMMKALFVAIVFVGSARGQEWPDISAPAAAVGGGARDAAVIVGIESYAFVPRVPGAEANAKAWYDYLTQTRGVPPQNVKLLTGVDSTREEMLAAAGKAAGKASPDGVLWFVFVGHGAPSADGKDGLLVAVDAQQKSDSLQERSLRRGELLKTLSQSRAKAIAVVIDACFSGRRQDGAPLAAGLQPLVATNLTAAADPRVVVLTAAKGDQFAGALPGAQRPAFSYLVLGALRGWAKSGPVTAGDLWRYASDALDATLRGRNQTPELMGAADVVIGAAAKEKGPNLADLAKMTAGAGAKQEMFRVSSLAAVPVAEIPKDIGQVPSSIDFGKVDVDSLERYDAAVKYDKGDAAAEDKASSWRRLAKSDPNFAELSSGRATEWDRFAEQTNAAHEALRGRILARNGDWRKLSRLLALEVVPAADKMRWADEFLKAYWESPKIASGMAKALLQHLSPSQEHRRAELNRLALVTSSSGEALGSVEIGKAGIEWIRIPAGVFQMGVEHSYADAAAVHRVAIKSFEMARTEVTNKQYGQCVAAGACTPPEKCRGDLEGGDQPVICVDWNQAKAFSEWVGGRLPTEAEWEYAARSAGKDRKFPWGNEAATCERAVVSIHMPDKSYVVGCGRGITWPVCSKPKGDTEQGLCDMAGNASEWVRDTYVASYDGAPDDGSAREGNDNGSRVVRGGAFYYPEESARTYTRGQYSPDKRYAWNGFRPAR